MNERARKELLVRYLPLIFPGPEYRSKLDEFAAGAETHVSTTVSTLSEAVRGFVDTLNGTLIIEFKADLTGSQASEQAVIELKRYVASLWTAKGTEAAFCCIATDVLRWRIFQPVLKSLHTSGPYTADMVDLQELEYIDASAGDEQSAAHLALTLKRVLFDEILLELNSDSLRRNFGRYSAQYAAATTQIARIIEDAQTVPAVELALDLWSNYQSYNARASSKFDLDLYTAHVYLVLLSRIVVAASLQARQSISLDDSVIRDILVGDFFERELRVSNFVEKDVFGWVTKEPWIGKLLSVCRGLFHSVRGFDFKTVSTHNILRLIYEEMMPQEQRDILGQRSTPDLLAEAMVARLFQNRNGPIRFLDPACGTGAFLRAAISNIRQRLEEQHLSSTHLLAEILNSVTGIDVDPVSVILAKANWVLSVEDLLTNAAHPVNIPIYHADSLFIATDQLIRSGQIYKSTAVPKITFDGVAITIPTELFNDPIAFDKFVAWSLARANVLFRSAVERTSSVRNIALVVEASEIAKIVDAKAVPMPKQADLATAAKELVVEFAFRMEKCRNGIWAFVVRNSYRPTMLYGQFDVIATNPPWLAMSSLPDIPYKTQLEARAETFGISPMGSSFLHTEIATTFALHTIKHFLRKNGDAAFVMPRSVFDGDNHDPFRTQKYRNMVEYKFTEVWDLGNVEGLFAIPACVLIGEKDTVPDAPQTHLPAHLFDSLSVTRLGEIVLARYGKKTAWRQTIPQVTIKSRGHYKDLFQQGADLMPRTAVFVELLNPSQQQETISIQTSSIELANRLNKVLVGRRFRGLINKRFLFCTVTSSYLLPFVVLEDELPLVALPLEFRFGIPTIVSDEEFINAGQVETSAWFNQLDAELETNRIRDRIDVRRKLTRQQYQTRAYLVHVGASGKIPCAGIQTNHCRAAYPFVADQTTYVYGTDSEDEALYLTGMLNSAVLASGISDFQARGLFGERHIHTLAVDAIPMFSSSDDMHLAMARIAKRIVQVAQLKLSVHMRDATAPLPHRRTEMRNAIELDLEGLESLAATILSS